MAFVSDSLPISTGISSRLMSLSYWVNNKFGAASGNALAGNYAIDTVPLVDERLRPKVPMPKDSIEILTRLNLSNMGLLNAQEVTAESHPELYSAWLTLSQRAGFTQKTPQLIITESKMANAFEIGNGQMVITTGLLKMLTMREVVGVVAHELGHGRHNHTGMRRVALAGFGAAGLVTGDYIGHHGGLRGGEATGRFFNRFGRVGRSLQDILLPQRPEGGHLRPTSFLGYIAYMFVGYQIGNVAANQISVKPSELQADLDSVAISGDGEALASALLKMQAADRRGPLSRFAGYLVSGYPTMEQRVTNIRRATAELPYNPVPAVLEPAPEAAEPKPHPQVSGVQHAERVQADAVVEQAL
jgi:Zn-dependent protease with chaperone function